MKSDVTKEVEKRALIREVGADIIRLQMLVNTWNDDSQINQLKRLDMRLNWMYHNISEVLDNE